jgi:hypothetical protein
LELKELDEFLLARAMEHDSPTLLFRVACEFLISGCVIRPGVVPLSRQVAATRAAATGETYERLAHLLTAGLREELDELLVVDADLGSTRLHWLSRGPRRRRRR